MRSALWTSTSGSGWHTRGLALAVTAVWTSSSVPNVRRVEGAETLFSISALFRAPKLLVPALVVLSSFLMEGSMDVSSGLPPRSTGGVGHRGGPGVCRFATAVLFGRLFASEVLLGRGPADDDPGGGLRSLIGGTIAVAADEVFVVALGFLVSAPRSPPRFRRRSDWSGDSRRIPTNAIAAVTTVGYTGFIWSPPLLGWIAQSSACAQR